MFCRECGSEVPKKTKVCPSCESKPLNGTKHCQSCGTKTKSTYGVCKKCGAELIHRGDRPVEKTSFIAKGAAFAMPFIGFLMYMSWRDKKPEKAKVVGHWTLMGLGFGVILYILGIISGAINPSLGL